MRDRLLDRPKYRLVFCTRSADGVELMSQFACDYERALFERHYEGTFEIAWEDQRRGERLASLRDEIHAFGVSRGMVTLKQIRHALVPCHFAEFRRPEYDNAVRELVDPAGSSASRAESEGLHFLALPQQSFSACVTTDVARCSRAPGAYGRAMIIDTTAAARRADPERAREWLANQRVFISSAMGDTADERRRVVAVGIAMTFTFSAVFSYVVYRLSSPPFSLGPGARTLIYSLWLVGMFAPAAGRVADRAGWRGLSLLALIGVTIGALLTLPNSLWCLAPALAIFALSSYSGTIAAQLGVSASKARSPQRASSLFFSSYYTANALGAFLPGVGYESYGWIGVVVAVVGCCALSTIALLAGTGLRALREVCP
jgi:hypothetical protein